MHVGVQIRNDQIAGVIVKDFVDFHRGAFRIPATGIRGEPEGLALDRRRLFFLLLDILKDARFA